MKAALRWLPLVVLGLALLGGGIAWWRHAYERVSETVDLPRTGEAATNPLFALRIALEKDGRRVRPWRRMDPDAMALGPRDSLVLDGDPRMLAGDDVDALLRWVRGGGYLVVATPAPEPAVDVLQRTRRAGASTLPVPLLDAVGVRTRLAPPACLDLRPPGLSAHREFCEGRRFDAPPHARLRWGDDAGDAFARIPLGEGMVDVLAELDFLRTGERDQAADGLQDCTHVALARQLVARMDRSGTVHLVHVAAMPSLWTWLLREAWRAWLPLALLLAGWLWARVRRFGPQIPSPARERRSLLEHVGASGEHQWRYGDGDRLFDAMRGAFLARLRRRDPHGAALAGKAQVEYLATRLRMPPAQIVDALTPPDPRDGRSLLARIALLVRMRNRL
jgi:hypothetical protein